MKYCRKITYNFITTDPNFKGIVTDELLKARLYNKKMFGKGLYCTKLWAKVDHVFLPIMTKNEHWILGRFDVKKRATHLRFLQSKAKLWRN